MATIYHASDPSALVEAVFLRIWNERMVGMPMLNPALQVAAVGFSCMDGREWRGALITPWSLNLLLLPATLDGFSVAEHERAFRRYPAGVFAFLGNREAELGNYLSCPLFHAMNGFADQKAAVMTAHACLSAIDRAPAAAPTDTSAPQSPGRRRFLALGG